MCYAGQEKLVIFIDIFVIEEHRKKIKLVRVGPKSVINPKLLSYTHYELAKKYTFDEICKTDPEFGIIYKNKQVEVNRLQHEVNKCRNKGN